MRVHVFGNTPFLMIAICRLRRATKEAEFGAHVRTFIETYVVDALKSFATEPEAVGVIKRTKEMLSCSCLKTAQDHNKQCSHHE